MLRSSQIRKETRMHRSPSAARRALLWSAAAAVAGLTVTAASAQPTSSEVRSLEAFSAIVLRGDIDLRVRQSTQQRVEISADGARLAALQTTVQMRDGVPTLVVQWASGSSMRAWSNSGPAVVTVDATTLSALSAMGSGDVDVQALRVPALALSIRGSSDMALRSVQTERLSIAIAGSGDVIASGRADTLEISIAGSGDVQARDLSAQTATVSIAGSGDASLNVAKTLSVSISGSGDVDYAGGAALAQSRVAGSGSVRQRP
jgi:hypothetical protein